MGVARTCRWVMQELKESPQRGSLRLHPMPIRQPAGEAQYEEEDCENKNKAGGVADIDVDSDVVWALLAATLF